ncbi:MAG: VOC family protein [Pseudomonadota bacterium]
MSLLEFDHIAVSCTDLQRDAQTLESRLNVPLAQGGHHPTMGTYNRLLSLGPSAYFELIAIDPEAPPPGRPRWFGLDQFSGPARLTNWILRCQDLDDALAVLPSGFGTPMTLQRGNLRWRMAVPETGILPFEGWAPALIEWQSPTHPCQSLPDQNVRLDRLCLKHPQSTEMHALLAPLLEPGTIHFEPAERPALLAEFETPAGRVAL